MKIKIIFIFLTILIIPLFLKKITLPVKADTPQLTIKDLGVLSGTTISQAFAINDLGQIVGRSSNLEGVDDRAFIWQNGQMIELPNLGNDPTVAYGINKNSQIAGGSKTISGIPSAVLWQNGQIQSIASPSAINSLALGINNNSEIVGWSVISQQGTNIQHDFDWQNGSITDITLKDSPYSGSPLAINDNGEIVGWAAYSDGTGLYPTFPLLWLSKYNSATKITTLSSTRMTNLAHGINNKGQFVGDYDPTNTGHSHAFLWDNGQVTDLGSLGGTDAYAQAINDNGQIVGGSLLADGSTEHAFLWQSGQMYDLGTLGGVNSFANAINNEGQIVGYSYVSSGSAHAVLWSSVIPTPTNTPTPIVGDGLQGTYFNNKNLKNPPVLTKVDPNINFNWAYASPDLKVHDDNFSVRWTGYLLPKYTEKYIFYANSDDGMRVWVNGKRVINDWFDHLLRESTGTVKLQAGVKTSIEVDYYEHFGKARAELKWSSSSIPKEIIPQANLFSH